MELTELNLTEEQLTGVQNILQSEGDKIRTKYSKEIAELKSKIPVEKSKEEIAREKEYADFKREKAEFELQKALTNKGLNGELAKYLKGIGEGEDLETYLTGLNEILGKNRNNFVPNSHATQNNNITKEDFKKMNYSQRVNLYNSNKELYDILSK